MNAMLFSRATRQKGECLTPRWIAFLGFACALLLLFSGRYIDWILLVFPLWALLISIYILIDNLRRPSEAAGRNQGPTDC
jgi:hypothetical protein